MNDGLLYGVVGAVRQTGYWIKEGLGIPWGVCWRATQEEAIAYRSRCQFEAEAFIRWQKNELAEKADERPDWESRLLARRRLLLDKKLPDHEDAVEYVIVIMHD